MRKIRLSTLMEPFTFDSLSVIWLLIVRALTSNCTAAAAVAALKALAHAPRCINPDVAMAVLLLAEIKNVDLILIYLAWDILFPLAKLQE